MPFDIHHPAAICKILLYACTAPHQPFILEQVSPEWYDAIEPDAAAAVIQKLNVNSTKQKISGHVLNFGKEGFLQGSTEIENFDARPLWNIKLIDRNFLSSSARLRHVDFSGITFECCTEISDQFLSGCFNLISIDISSFVNVEKIGCNFLSNCSSLQEINLGAFGSGKIRSIMAGFCCGCTSLVSVDVSPIARNCRHLPNSFFARCKNLKEIKGLQHFENRLVSIGANFLAATAIEEIDVSFLNKVERIDVNFLSGCNNLTKIANFDKVTSVTAIARGFLHFVPIKRLVLNNQRKCTLLDCGEIIVSRQAIPTGFRESRGFLYGCNFLKEIDVSSMISLKQTNLIGFGSQPHAILSFLRALPSLERIVLPKQAIRAFDDSVKAGENNNSTTSASFAAFLSGEKREGKVKLPPSSSQEEEKEEEVEEVEVLILDIAQYRKRRGMSLKKFHVDPDWPIGKKNKNSEAAIAEQEDSSDETEDKKSASWYDYCVLQ